MRRIVLSLCIALLIGLGSLSAFAKVAELWAINLTDHQRRALVSRTAATVTLTSVQREKLKDLSSKVEKWEATITRSHMHPNGEVKLKLEGKQLVSVPR